MWYTKVQIYEGQTQYKYYVAQYDDSTKDVVWEGGPNRVYNKDIGCTSCRDSWNHRMIKIMVKMPHEIKSLNLSGI